MRPNVCISHPEPVQYGRLGELILLVDRYIYPPMLGSCATAGSVMEMLMNIPNSPFAPEHIKIASIGDTVAGVIVSYGSPFSEMPDLSAFCDSPCVPVSCKHVCDYYLTHMLESLKDGETYIACIATDPDFRGQGIASALIENVLSESDGKNASLDVLCDNANAIRLYEKYGFEIVGETTGYAYDEEPPKVYQMRR